MFTMCSKNSTSFGHRWDDIAAGRTDATDSWIGEVAWRARKARDFITL
jgi:hypothetical protein